MLDAPALVIGSLPPDGNDLDLLLPPARESAVEAILEGHGFARQSVHPFDGYPEGFTIWARFAGCDAEVVDAIPLGNLELSPAEADRLFADARPIPGFARLVRPAPHHVLLILAHNFLSPADGRARLPAGRRRRVERALGEDPLARERARALASAWGRPERLARLEAAFDLGHAEKQDDGAAESRRGGLITRLQALRTYRRVWRHGHVVAFSSADGQLRRAQADGLARALHALDLPVEVVRPGGAAPAPRWSRVAPFAHLVAGAAALRRAAAHRRAVLPGLHRGAVVICDGYGLDAAVEFRARYGERRRFGLQLAVMRALSPRPRRAYLLDTGTPAAVRYTEHRTAFGVRVVDASRAPEQICAEIAADVWPAVR